MKFLLVIVACLAGCATTSTRFEDQSGQTAYYIHCSYYLDRCYEAALLTCPTGYSIMNIGQAQYNAQVTSSLIIACQPNK